MRLLKLGVKAADRVSGLKGMLTHCQIGSDLSEYYLFQPRGINPETGKPVKGSFLTSDRVDGVERVEIAIPTQVLGTEVSDMASGYKGIVIALTLHINGCVHALVQAPGCVKRTGAPIDSCDFDIRQLEGKKVPKMTVSEKNEDKKHHPSPSPVALYRPRI